MSETIQTEKKKRNWSTILLWILLIASLAYSAILTKGLIKARKDMAFKSDVKFLKNKLNNSLSFSIQGLQVVDDNLKVSVEDISKYANGYKVKFGVLNASVFTLENIKFSILNTTEWAFIPIVVNKKVPSGYMTYIDVVIPDKNEHRIFKEDWAFGKSNASFHYKTMD